MEGYLTAERMSQFYSNFYPLLQPNEVQWQRVSPKIGQCNQHVAHFGPPQDSTLAMMNIRLTLIVFLASIC